MDFCCVLTAVKNNNDAKIAPRINNVAAVSLTLVRIPMTKRKNPYINLWGKGSRQELGWSCLMKKLRSRKSQRTVSSELEYIMLSAPCQRWNFYQSIIRDVNCRLRTFLAWFLSTVQVYRLKSVTNSVKSSALTSMPTLSIDFSLHFKYISFQIWKSAVCKYFKRKQLSIKKLEESFLNLFNSPPPGRTGKCKTL